MILRLGFVLVPKIKATDLNELTRWLSLLDRFGNDVTFVTSQMHRQTSQFVCSLINIYIYIYTHFPCTSLTKTQ